MESIDWMSFSSSKRLSASAAPGTVLEDEAAIACPRPSGAARARSEARDRLSLAGRGHVALLL
eukprot:2073052-Prymnesium_polylepis.1